MLSEVPAHLSSLPKRRRKFCLSGLISLPVLVAFGAYNLPARAMPEASLQLFRVNPEGFTTVPAINSAIQAISNQNQPKQGSQIALASSSPAAAILNSDYRPVVNAPRWVPTPLPPPPPPLPAEIRSDSISVNPSGFSEPRFNLNRPKQGSQIALASGSPAAAILNSDYHPVVNPTSWVPTPLPSPPPPLPTEIRSDSVSVNPSGLSEPRTSKSASPFRVSPSLAAKSQLLAQVDPSSDSFTLRQTFIAPLPRNLSGNVRVVLVGEDGTLGNILEEIPFNSSRVIISPDRTELTINPSVPAPQGQLVMLQLPSRSPDGVPFVYPNHLESTPCIARVPAPSPQALSPTPTPGANPASAAIVAAPAAAAGINALWIVVGAVVVGVGVAAAAGAFNGGGGGGTNTSSR